MNPQRKSIINNLEERYASDKVGGDYDAKKAGNSYVDGFLNFDGDGFTKGGQNTHFPKRTSSFAQFDPTKYWPGFGLVKDMGSGMREKSGGGKKKLHSPKPTFKFVPITQQASPEPSGSGSPVPPLSVELAGTFSWGSSSVFYLGTSSLFWSASQTDGYFLTMYRADQFAYPTFSVISSPTSASTYDDTTVLIGTTYTYKLYASNSFSAAFSNEVTLGPYPGALDSFEDYEIDQVFRFNSGTGSWSGRWWTEFDEHIVAFDHMDEYYEGQNTNLSGGFGWVNNWTGSFIQTLVAYDTWEEYNIGQTTNFSGGFGWSSSLWTIQ